MVSNVMSTQCYKVTMFTGSQAYSINFINFQVDPAVTLHVVTLG